MKQLLLAAIAALVLTFSIHAQTGYIYVHQKNINEESSVDFNFSLLNSANTAVNNWKLNDQPTADNVVGSGNQMYIYDIGVGHGTSGNGELWVVAGNAAAGVSNTGNNPGSVYRRVPASSTWTTTSPLITNAISIDGAYANQFVYAISSSPNVFFYYNGTVTTLPSTGSNVTDVTCNNGRIAALTSSGRIYLYSASYTSTAAPATNGTWTLLATPGQGSRIDMNVGATAIAVIIPGTATIYTVSFTGTATSIGNAGSGATGSVPDITYDDNNNIYATVYDNSNGGTDVVASYNGSTWTTETPARKVMRLTGGDAKQVYGIENLGRTGFPQSIWFRAQDNTGTAYWIDDERLRSSSTLNGNGILIPVTPGTYTVQETLPSTSWDLGRFNIYDPGNNNVPNVGANSAKVTVTAGEVVYVEFVNEKLNPKAISLTCTNQTLQSFDLNSFGTGAFGTYVEGTAYHFYAGSSPEDGYYFLAKNTNGNWFSNPLSADHTGNGGYFLLVNASYAKDEFYRQRVTNLVPGLQYTISFYAVNVSSGSPIAPNVQYGLQDLNGNIVNSATSGTFATDNNWHLYSFNFTATTSTADLFLRNQTIGGNGNDIAIDDISLNPVLTTLGANQISPTVAPNLCVNSVYTFSNTPTGGQWFSSNPTIASININTGVATAKTAGTVIITYEYTNQVGCVSDTSRVLAVTAPPTVTADDLLGKTMCLNQADSLFATVTGTATPFTYAWTATPAGNGLGTANVARTTAAPSTGGTYTYTVTATDAVGCSASADVTIVVSNNQAPNVQLNTSGVNCVNNTANFSLTAVPTGGSGSYTYAWSGTPTGNGIVNVNAATTSASPSAAGSYTYTVRVNDGFCTVPVSKTVTAFASPSVAVSPASGTINICKNGTIPLTAVPSPTGTYTYAWSGSPSGNGLSGTPTTQSTQASPNNAGTYTYTVIATNSDGCKATASTTQTVTINNAIAAPTINITSPNAAVNGCVGQGSVSLKATVTNNSVGSTLSYLWTGPSTITNPTSITAATTVPSSTGVYTLTATSTFVIALGNVTTCSSTANTPVVTANAVPSVTAITYANTICTNTKDTIYAVASGGTTPYTYAWTVNPTSGATIATPAAATSPISVSTFGQNYTFTIKVTDANLCTATGSKTVSALNQSGPSYTSINGASSVCLNSTINLSAGVNAGANTTLSYSWSGTPATSGVVNANSKTTTAVPTAAGTYKYYIVTTDGAGCKATDSTAVQTIFGNPSAKALASNPSFCGAADSIKLYSNPSGGTTPYTFSWTTVQSGTGTITFTPSASQQDPTVNLSGGSTSATFKFAIQVKDANNCIAKDTTTIITDSKNPVATAASSLAGTACTGQTINLTGTVTTATTAPYTYAWVPSSNSVVTPSVTTVSSTTSTASASTTTAGNYQFGLSVIDANNCTASTFTTSTIAINDTPTVVITPALPSVLCVNPVSTITITATPSGGSGTYTNYAWAGSGVVTTPTTTGSTTAKPTASGKYTVTVTDNNGCIGSGASSNVVVDAATPSISTLCGSDGGANSNVNYIALTETIGSSWLWTTTNGSRFFASKALSPATDGTTSTSSTTYVVYKGTYNVDITKSNGCKGSGFITVTASTCSSSVLPLTLVNFIAEKQKKAVQLTWGTITETNTAYFIIERSGDGLNWQNIGQVQASGNSSTAKSYLYNDETPLAGANYYRLRIVDTDTKVAYSAIRTVRFTADWMVRAYPNPATDFLVLEFDNDKEEKALITIQTVLGGTVFTKEQTIVKGLNRIILNQVQPLAQGTYVITLATQGNIYRDKFIKGAR